MVGSDASALSRGQRLLQRLRDGSGSGADLWTRLDPGGELVLSADELATALKPLGFSPRESLQLLEFLDVEGEGYQVLRYELTEELSEVSWLKAELTQHDVDERKDATPPKDLISKTATLTQWPNPRARMYSRMRSSNCPVLSSWRNMNSAYGCSPPLRIRSLLLKVVRFAVHRFLV